ncbi:MAG: phage head closure protein [Mogibacterium sp.]|nr:phage head closure protein [Mogibacterium sp.]
MFDDVITLIKPAGGYVKDSVGNQIPNDPVRTTVFCRVRSITRSEYYQAAQTDLHPEYTFVLSHYKDWHGEREIEYIDWTGQKKIYDVIRTYRVPDTDRLELTAQERIANYEGS